MNNVELVKRGIDAFNKQDWPAVLQLSASNLEVYSTGGMHYTNLKDIEQFTRNWWIAFPDAKVEIQNLYCDGDVVIEYGIFNGTHKGVFQTPMGDIPATGKTARGEYIQFHHIRDGKVCKQQLFFDRMLLMEQLGLVPQPAVAGSR